MGAVILAMQCQCHGLILQKMLLMVSKQSSIVSSNQVLETGVRMEVLTFLKVAGVFYFLVTYLH